MNIYLPMNFCLRGLLIYVIVTGVAFVTSQNFKREEQNFVVQNEINNMSFLISDTKSKMSKVFPCCAAARGSPCRFHWLIYFLFFEGL